MARPRTKKESDFSSFSIKIPIKLRKELEKLANQEHRSINGTVTWAIEKILDVSAIAKSKGKSINGTLDLILENFKIHD